MRKSLGMGSDSYKLDLVTVNSNVEEKKIGNYALGYKKDGIFYVKYVGRSDSDLRKRIKGHIGEKKNMKSLSSNMQRA